MQPQSEFFGSDTRKNGFPSYFSDSHIFVYIDIEESSLEDSAHEVSRKIADYIRTYDTHSLAHLESAVAEAFRMLNLPVQTSLAVAVRENNTIYLKTTDCGAIFIQREKKIARIMSGEKSASGRVKVEDVLILTTHEGERKNLEDFKKSSALIIAFPPEVEYAVPIVPTKKQSFFSKLQVFSHLPSFFKTIREPKKKSILTLMVVGLIFIIFVWSVVLGYQRRMSEQTQKKIQTSREIITQKLSQAEDVAVLNLARAQTLIGEARVELEMVRKEVGPKRKELDELENVINQKAGKITKKEEKQAQEFYDLTLDTVHAQGVVMGVNGDVVVVLDTSNQKLYILSLSKRSLDKKNFAQLQNARMVGVFNDDSFFFVPNEGMYKITGSSVKKVIEQDSEWEQVADFTLYNGNIYLLDQSKNKIYKYAATDSGFASKSAYLKDPSIQLSGASSLAIDSSLYVSFSDHIAKFTGGLRDSFKTDLPSGSVQIKKVMTGKDMEKVYAWDKDHATVYVLGKEGTYERQVTSRVLGKASDVVVYANKAYALVKEKIYTVDLQ